MIRTTSLNPSREQAIFARPGLARSIAACTFFALMTGVFARIAIPLPFTPVPFTLQPLAVTLTGLLLGSRLGTAALAEYVLLGFAGAPLFAGGTAGLLYPASTGTLGYLLAYPLAAWVVGRLSERSGRSLLALSLAGLAGLVVIYSGGAAYLAAWLNVAQHVSGSELAARALVGGVMPFILFDLAKAVLAAAVARKKLFES